MPKTFEQIPAKFSSAVMQRVVMVLMLIMATALPSSAAAQIKLSPTLTGQYATTGGLVLDTAAPEWYVGQDVYINYRITNPTNETAQNITLTYAISGLVPYDYTMAMSGLMTEPIIGAGNIYITYMAPGSSLNFFVKTRVSKTGTNYFQVFYTIPVTGGGSGRTEGNIYFACTGVNGEPHFNDIGISLWGPPEGLAFGEKTTATLLVQNNGMTTVTGITANFVIPAGDFLAVIDAIETTTGLTQLQNKHQMTASWIIEELGPGLSLEMILTVHPTTFNSFQVEAVCAAAGTDIFPENNSIEAIIPVTGRDRKFELQASVFALPSETHTGGFTANIIAVTNHGPDDALAITVHTPGKDHQFAQKIIAKDWSSGPASETLTYQKRLPPGETAAYVYLDMIQPGETGDIAPNTKSVSATAKTPWTETNMADNSATATVVFASQPSPDSADLSLVPLSTPAYGFQAQMLPITYALRNNGPSPVTNAYAGIYLTGQGQITSVDSERGDSTITARYAQLTDVTLAPGEQIPVTFNVMPEYGGLLSYYAGIASGVYDPANGNDYAAATLPIFVVSGDDLDLTGDLQASAVITYLSGRWLVHITGNLTVSNGGGYSVPAASIPVRFYLSNDETPSETDTLIHSDEIPPIWSGSSYNLPIDISFLSAARALNKHLIAVIDPDNTIPEVSKDNNVSTVYLP